MRLREYLTLHGLTEAAFAQRIGVTQQSVNRYCIGQVVPKAAVMRRIIAETGRAVTADDFHPEIVSAEVAA